MTSNSNAALVRKLNKKYLFALKANFGKLFPLAQEALECEPVLASTTERVAGCNVTRQLRRVEFPSFDYDFKDADELWGVRQITVGSEGEHSVESRIFIVPEHKLKNEACLQLVRTHWGIENGPNWTADVLLKEDSRTPCGVGNGVLVMAWLRLLAYNFLSVFRAHLPKRDRHFDRWQHVASLVYRWLVTYDYVYLSSRERAINLSELVAASV
jgi:predicted transposase YbfD/YdcC